MNTQLIFVYGTLRSGIVSPMDKIFGACCTYLCNGTLQGKLYEVDGYPGAILSKKTEDSVQGELYTIKNNEILALLDTYEECTNAFATPHEYVRIKCPILCTDHETLEAWVYLYNYDTSSLLLIPSGDYKEFLDDTKD